MTDLRPQDITKEQKIIFDAINSMFPGITIKWFHNPLSAYKNPGIRYGGELNFNTHQIKDGIRFATTIYRTGTLQFMVNDQWVSIDDSKEALKKFKREYAFANFK